MSSKYKDALRELLEAVIREVDMDAVSPALGTAVNEAGELLKQADRRAEILANDRYTDQSKW